MDQTRAGEEGADVNDLDGAWNDLDPPWTWPECIFGLLMIVPIYLYWVLKWGLAKLTWLAICCSVPFLAGWAIWKEKS